MDNTTSNSCKVLTYGQDKTLLHTRRDLLKTVGIDTDVSLNGRDFLDCIMSSERGYDLFILCHSVPLEEQEVIVDAAVGSDVEIYVLRDIVMPNQFLRQVLHLTGRS